MNRAGAINLTQETDKASHRYLFLLVLVGLVALRLLFFGGLALFEIQWKWTRAVYDIGTYLLTTFLIWWEIDHLADYHIDSFVVILVIVFKPIQTLVLRLWGFTDDPLAFPNAAGWAFWLIALVFALAMWQRRSRLPALRPGTKRWVLIGLLAGVLTALALSYPASLQIQKAQLVSGMSMGLTLLYLPVKLLLEFPYLVAYAGVSEEPLYRGFLWGYLRKSNWPEGRIWLFQAGLFSLSHTEYIIRYPISLWILVPVCALVLGWLAWRSRSIAASLAAHGMIDATGYTFGYLVALCRLG